MSNAELTEARGDKVDAALALSNTRPADSEQFLEMLEAAADADSRIEELTAAGDVTEDSDGDDDGDSR